MTDDYYPDSFAGIGLRARRLAMAGETPDAISQRLDVPICFARAVVNECLKHKAEFAAAVRVRDCQGER